jgi:hypothetical protein
MSKVEIRQDENHRTHIFVDGAEVKGASKAVLTVDAASFPVLELSIPCEIKYAVLDDAFWKYIKNPYIASEQRRERGNRFVSDNG